MTFNLITENTKLNLIHENIKIPHNNLIDNNENNKYKNKAKIPDLNSKNKKDNLQ